MRQLYEAHPVIAGAPFDSGIAVLFTGYDEKPALVGVPLDSAGINKACDFTRQQLPTRLSLEAHADLMAGLTRHIAGNDVLADSITAVRGILRKEVTGLSIMEEIFTKECSENFLHVNYGPHALEVLSASQLPQTVYVQTAANMQEPLEALVLINQLLYGLVAGAESKSHSPHIIIKPTFNDAIFCEIASWLSSHGIPNVQVVTFDYNDYPQATGQLVAASGRGMGFGESRTLSRIFKGKNPDEFYRYGTGYTTVIITSNGLDEIGLDAISDMLIKGAVSGKGARCTSVDQVICVGSDVYQQVCNALLEKGRKLKLGNPFDASVDLSSYSHETLREVEQFLAQLSKDRLYGLHGGEFLEKNQIGLLLYKANPEEGVWSVEKPVPFITIGSASGLSEAYRRAYENLKKSSAQEFTYLALFGSNMELSQLRKSYGGTLLFNTQPGFNPAYGAHCGRTFLEVVVPELHAHFSGCVIR